MVENIIGSYLKEVKRHDVLTREYVKNKNELVANKLIVSNLRFVISTAKKYIKYHNDLSDIIQQGNIGLIKALNKFDPERGNRFITYASWWINSSIREFIMRNNQMVKVGTTQAERAAFRKIITNKPIEDVAKCSGMTMEQAEAFKYRTGAPTLSLNNVAPLSSDDSHLEYIDVIKHNAPGQDEIFEELEIIKHLYKMIEKVTSTMNVRDKDIFLSRTFSSEPETLANISKKHNVSRERIRQLEQRIVKTMRNELSREIAIS